MEKKTKKNAKRLGRWKANVVYGKSGERPVSITLIDAKTGELDNDGGPSVIEYYDQPGKLTLKLQEWYIKDELHRDDGPAITKYFNDGAKDEEIWYKHGLEHRENGPAIISYNDKTIISETWINEGVVHRIDGPADIRYHDEGTSDEFLFL